MPEPHDSREESGPRTIEFWAVLPDPHQSAVSFAGDGTVRVRFESPESERVNMLPLVLLTGRWLRIRVDYELDKPKQADQGESIEDAPNEGQVPAGEATTWNLKVLEDVGGGQGQRKGKPRSRPARA
ncbi:MAG: hypothetical protein QOH93_1236 [Chloroflexia bacterium]|jgi:hypothetical protein|nr:hypothetical protein [Chloroflexia bacterium]